MINTDFSAIAVLVSIAALLMTVIFALRKMSVDRMDYLEKRIDQEAARAKDALERAEKKIDDIARTSEERLRNETQNVERRLMESLRLVGKAEK